jgi:hypothetical protein
MICGDCWTSGEAGRATVKHRTNAGIPGPAVPAGSDPGAVIPVRTASSRMRSGQPQSPDYRDP